MTKFNTQEKTCPMPQGTGQVISFRLDRSRSKRAQSAKYQTRHALCAEHAVFALAGGRLVIEARAPHSIPRRPDRFNDRPGAF